MKKIIDFLDVHAGKVAVIYGKGPSLTKHDFDQDPELRIGINDAAYVVPDCTYIFCHDAGAGGIIKKAKIKTPEIIAVLPLEFGYFEDDTVIYEKTWDLCPEHSVSVNQNSLWHGHCSAHSAFHFLAITGVKKIKLVGFDCKWDSTHYFDSYPAVAKPTKDLMDKDENFESHINDHYARYFRMLIGMSLILGVEII